MREILFRGKSLNRCEYVEGFLFKTKENTYIAYAEQYDDDLFLSPQNIFVEVFPETVGQYTGLTDKNGKKIFEGDIIEGHCHSQWSHRLQRCVVEYDRDGFEARHYVKQGEIMRYYSYKVLFSKDVVVIGNIHDNPELLKGADDENR